RGRGHADRHGGREPRHGVRGAVDRERHVADHGGEWQFDDYRDGAGRQRQPDRGRDRHAGGHTDGREHADAARRDDERERGRDRDALLDGGGVEDGVGDDRRGCRQPDRTGRRERRGGLRGAIDRKRHVADRGGERELDDHGDREGRQREPDPGRDGHAYRDTDRGEHVDPARRDDERQRGRDGDALLDGGGVEDGIGRERRGGGQ